MLFLKSKPEVERILVSDHLFSKVAEMRYRVYCEELGFLEKYKYPHLKESDEFDGHSIHVVVRVGRRLGGYARVILPNGEGLPIFQHFELPAEEDMQHSCEISRFMISKYFRRKAATRREIFRLLATEINAIIEENNIDRVYAVIEKWLLDSLNKRGYNFKQIGEGRYYMGAVTFPTRLVVK
jgi:N-acyl amino acid synthase of PEP-CTERM/exosortase system